MALNSVSIFLLLLTGPGLAGDSLLQENLAACKGVSVFIECGVESTLCREGDRLKGATVKRFRVSGEYPTRPPFLAGRGVYGVSVRNRHGHLFDLTPIGRHIGQLFAPGVNSDPIPLTVRIRAVPLDNARNLLTVTPRPS